MDSSYIYTHNFEDLRKLYLFVTAFSYDNFNHFLSFFFACFTLLGNKSWTVVILQSRQENRQTLGVQLSLVSVKVELQTL